MLISHTKIPNHANILSRSHAKRAHKVTRWKVYWETTTHYESLSPTLATPTKFLELQFQFWVLEGMIQCLRYGCRFTGFFDRYFQMPLPIATKHELGLPFPPRNLPIKFGTNPSTIFLVIVVTDRHTERYKPTPVKTYSHAFAERINTSIIIDSTMWS